MAHDACVSMALTHNGSNSVPVNMHASVYEGLEHMIIIHKYKIIFRFYRE
jgi:hypothetical protein